MRRIQRIGILLAAGLSVLPAIEASAEPSILFDARSGTVIESEDAFARWYPASLTKLMTTYVAFRMVHTGEISLTSPIRMSKEAAKEPPSKMGFKPGTVITLDAALKLIMVKSANDVAAAIGDSLGGSKEGFAAKMNAEAARLGMTGTHWVNANGWHDDNQYTTPRDMGILSLALRREFPQYAGYFSLEGLTVGKSSIPNHNTLIGRFQGADGMKTGYTCPSGYNLVASATRDGRTLMAVVMGSRSVAERAEKAAAMLARGFQSPALGGPTISGMAPSGAGRDQAVNMYDQLCSKDARAALAKQRQAEQKAKKAAGADQSEDDAAAEKSQLLARLDRPRKLVTVTLGGASGPVPKAVAAMIAADSEPGVPLPTWRPDLPSPAGAEPMIVQGDAAALAQ